jgi:cytochrome c
MMAEARLCFPSSKRPETLRLDGGRTKWPGGFPMVWLFVLSLALVTLPDSAAAAPRYSRDAEAAKGKQVFQLCSGCHSTESDKKKVGPSLRGLFKRSSLGDGQPVTEKNIRIVIQKGRDGMPSFSEALSPQQIDQLIAYLKEL